MNTLQYECTQFYLDHRRDGRNYSANDRFPCYYTPDHGRFVTTRCRDFLRIETISYINVKMFQVFD